MKIKLPHIDPKVNDKHHHSYTLQILQLMKFWLFWEYKMSQLINILHSIEFNLGTGYYTNMMSSCEYTHKIDIL